jgi:hypothetical protein
MESLNIIKSYETKVTAAKEPVVLGSRDGENGHDH